MTKEKQFARAKAITVLECMAIDLTGSLAGLKEANPMTEVLNQRLDAIDVAQEALREQPRWISVEERLPDTVKDVLTCRRNGYVQINYMLMPGKWRYGSVQVNPITHWMPLPEPPEEEV